MSMAMGGGHPPCREECPVCKRMISMNGLAQHSHRMKHVREGRMVKRSDGRIVRSLRDVIQELDEQGASNA